MFPQKLVTEYCTVLVQKGFPGMFAKVQTLLKEKRWNHLKKFVNNKFVS